MLLLFILLGCQCVHSIVLHPKQLRRSRESKKTTETLPNFDDQHAAKPISADVQLQSAPRRRHWSGEDAKEMIRQLNELKSMKAKQQLEATQEQSDTFLDKLVSLFKEKADDGGPKHDCFFSAFNCPVNPSRNIPGVRRVRITAEERQQLLATAQQQSSSHKRRSRHRL